MSYVIFFENGVSNEISQLKYSEPIAYKKVVDLIDELRNNPKTGTGHPKPLGGNLSGMWSRRITKKHRLLYTINDVKFIVMVVSVRGHYDDK
jgi:toxin YoeB